MGKINYEGGARVSAQYQNFVNSGGLEDALKAEEQIKNRGLFESISRQVGLGLDELQATSNDLLGSDAKANAIRESIANADRYEEQLGVEPSMAMEMWRYAPDVLATVGTLGMSAPAIAGSRLGAKALSAYKNLNALNKLGIDATIAGMGNVTSDFAHGQLRPDQKFDTSVSNVDPVRVAESFGMGAGFPFLVSAPMKGLNAGANKIAKARKDKAIKENDGEYALNLSAIDTSFKEAEGYNGISIADANGKILTPEELEARQKTHKDGSYEDILIVTNKEDGTIGEALTEGRLSEYGITSNTNLKGSKDIYDASYGGEDLIKPIKKKVSLSSKKNPEAKGETKAKLNTDEDFYILREIVEDTIDELGDTANKQAIMNDVNSKAKSLGFSKNQIDEFFDELESTGLNRGTGATKQADEFVDEGYSMKPSKVAEDDVYKQKDIAKDIVEIISNDNLAKDVLKASVLSNKDKKTAVNIIEQNVKKELQSRIDDKIKEIESKGVKGTGEAQKQIENLKSAREYLDKILSGSKDIKHLMSKIDDLEISNASIELRNAWKGEVPKKVQSIDVNKEILDAVNSNNYLAKAMKSYSRSGNIKLLKGQIEKIKEKGIRIPKEVKKLVDDLETLAVKADEEAKINKAKKKEDKTYKPIEDEKKKFDEKKKELKEKVTANKPEFKRTDRKLYNNDLIEDSLDEFGYKADDLLDDKKFDEVANDLVDRKINQIIETRKSDAKNNDQSFDERLNSDEYESLKDTTLEAIDDLVEYAGVKKNSSFYNLQSKRFDKYYESKAHTTVEFERAKNTKFLEDKVKELEKEVNKIESDMKRIFDKDEVYTIDDVPTEVRDFLKMNDNLNEKSVYAVVKKYLDYKKKNLSSLKASLKFRESIKEAIAIRQGKTEGKMSGLYFDEDMANKGVIFKSSILYNTNLSSISKVIDLHNNNSLKVSVDPSQIPENARASMVKQDDGSYVIYIKDNDINNTSVDLFHEYGHVVNDVLNMKEKDFNDILEFFKESAKYVDDRQGVETFSKNIQIIFDNLEIEYKNKGYTGDILKEEVFNNFIDSFMKFQIINNKKLAHIAGYDVEKIKSTIGPNTYALFENLLSESAKSHWKRSPIKLQEYMSTMVDIMNSPSLGFEKIIRNNEYAKLNGTEKTLKFMNDNRLSQSILKTKFGSDMAQMFDKSTWSTFIKTNSEFVAVQKIAGVVAGHRRNLENDIAEYKIGLEEEIAKHLGSDGDKNLGFSVNYGFHYIVDDYGSFDEIVKAVDSKDFYKSSNGLLESIMNMVDSKHKLDKGKLDKNFYTQIDRMLDAIAKEKTYKPMNKRFYPVNTSKDMIDEIARQISYLNKHTEVEKSAFKRDLLRNTQLFEQLNKEIAKRKIANLISKDSIKYRHKQMSRLFDNEFYRGLSQKIINDEKSLALNGEYNSQFGFNAGAEYQRQGLKLVTTKNKKDLVKTIYSINGNHIGFAPTKSYSFGDSPSILGKSGVNEAERGTDSVLIKLKNDKYGNLYVKGYNGKWTKLDKQGVEKFRKFGLYNINEKNKTGTIRITNASKIFSDEMYDYDFSKMSARNRYLTVAKEMNDIIYNNGIKDALDNGVLVQSLNGVKKPDEWTEIKLENGVSYFVKKKWKHQFMQEKGKEVRGAFGTALSVTAGIVDIVKNLYLVGTPAGYINSAISSLYSGLILSNNPFSYSATLKSVNKEFNDYLGLVAKKGKLDALGKDSSSIQEQITKHWIHDAYKNGIQSTLRNAHKAMGDYEKNQALSAMRYNRFFQTPSSVVNGLESIYLRPESNIGARVGEFYDKTEIIPKLTLIKTKMKEGMSQSDAIQYAKMAFPDYNMKLPPELNFISDFVPFLKFATNIPKILSFTAEERLSRLLGTKAIGLAMVYGSYMNADDSEKEQWFKDNDFIRVMDGLHLYTGSWSNIPNPFNIDASIPSHMLNPIDLADKMIMPYALNYGTWDN